MNNEIIDFVRKLDTEYSLLVDRVLENPGDPLIIVELIMKLKEKGNLDSVKTLIASKDLPDGLLKDAKDVWFSHPILTSELAMFLNAFDLGPAEDDAYLRGKIDEKKVRALSDEYGITTYFALNSYSLLHYQHLQL